MPDHRASWLEEDGDHPLILVDDGRRVGFALVNQAPSPHMQPGMDFRMSEFFVLRKHRGRGIGRRAVFALFDRFRGKWEISELARNAVRSASGGASSASTGAGAIRRRWTSAR